MAKTWLEIQYVDRVEKRDVTPDGRIGIAAGECPCCKAKPFRVQGCRVPQEHTDRDRVLKAGGRCVDCSENVGYLYATRDTLFGYEEDRAVLEMGRCRVY